MKYFQCLMHYGLPLENILNKSNILNQNIMHGPVRGISQFSILIMLSRVIFKYLKHVSISGKYKAHTKSSFVSNT